MNNIPLFDLKNRLAAAERVMPRGVVQDILAVTSLAPPGFTKSELHEILPFLPGYNNYQQAYHGRFDSFFMRLRCLLWPCMVFDGHAWNYADSAIRKDAQKLLFQNKSQRVSALTAMVEFHKWLLGQGRISPSLFDLPPCLVETEEWHTLQQIVSDPSILGAWARPDKLYKMSVLLDACAKARKKMTSQHTPPCWSSLSDKLKAGIGMLVVEDEPSIMQIYRLIFAEWGFTKAHFAADGKEAATILKQEDHEILLIITDFGLPDTTGLEILEMVSSIDHAPKGFILISGGVWRHKCLEQFFRMNRGKTVAFFAIAKPFRLDTLLAAIEITIMHLLNFEAWDRQRNRFEKDIVEVQYA